MYIKGRVKKDKRTKNLIKGLKTGDIAVICHKDLDEIGASSLVEKRVKCVINTDKTISGRYPNQGPTILLKANIPLYEAYDDSLFESIKDGGTIEIVDNQVIHKGKNIGEIKLLDEKTIKEQLGKGYDNLEKELDSFIENTLDYAKKEKGLVTGNVDIPTISTKLKNRHALIVVRGKDYKRDLAAIQAYIHEVNPILIGVDGGGDALIEFGYIPDIVIGDMDSVSDKCLKLSKEIIVHAYSNGKAPGLDRVNQLGLEAVIFPSPGTSEDIALLLAYDNGVDLIVAVGTHNNMIDFLEKGRNGMASTFLVRLKVGSKLVDAKGVNKLYRSHLKLKHVIGIGIAALIPIIVITMMFPPMKELLQLIKIRLKIMFGL